MDRAFPNGDQTKDGLEKRGLARAVVADDRDHLVCLGLKIDSVEDLLGTVTRFQSADL